MDKEDVLYVYKGILVSQKKRDEIMSFVATRIGLKSVILSEVSQKEKDKYHMIPLIRGV